MQRTTAYKPFLAWFAAFGFLWVWLLLYAGGFTTSIGAGMVFPDWPLSNGSINPDGWLQNQAMFAEHSHRIAGAKMGLITLGLAAWIWMRDGRRWVRQLAMWALVLVVVQGIIGGLRVLLDPLHLERIDNTLGRIFAMAHACLAQAFVCILLTLAAACSRSWTKDDRSLRPSAGSAVRMWTAVACSLIFAQLVIAAIMRHSYAGLAISTFPLAENGRLVPDIWDFRIGIHFAHRAMAVAITAAVIGSAWAIWRDAGAGSLLRRLSVLLLAGVGMQIYLGALIIWTGRNPHAATWHVLVGACLLAGSWFATLIAHRGPNPVEVPTADNALAGPGNSTATGLSRSSV